MHGLLLRSYRQINMKIKKMPISELLFRNKQPQNIINIAIKQSIKTEPMRN